MAWISGGSILLSSDWQYTEPIASGSFFRLKHTEAPNGGLFAIAQCEVDADGKLSLIDSQVLAVEKPITDVLRFSEPGCFIERRIAIKKLPRQPSLQQELRRLFLPGYLQPTEEEIRIVSRSNWSVDIEVSDFVEPALTVDFAPIHTKLDAITSSMKALQNLSSSPDPTPSPASNTTTLTYASDGDTNGLFYYLGTNKNTTAFSNPTTAGIIAVTQSTYSSYGKPEWLTDRGGDSIHTNNEPNSWVAIDLKTNGTFKCNYYSVKARSENNQNLRSFEFQGSNDFITWNVLDSKTNQTQISSDAWVSYPIPLTASYRYFRILQTGLNQNSSNFLVINELEIYGNLTT